MSTKFAKMRVTNSSDKPRIIWIEPYGEDYTLLPGEELTIEYDRDFPGPPINVVEWGESTAIDIDADFKVSQHGKQITCGHNRQAALDAGLKF